MRKILSDEMLRSDLEAGLSTSQIAAKHGMSHEGVRKRSNKLQQVTTTLTVAAPTESRRFVGNQIDIMQEMALSLRRVNLLMDACDEWLRDANDPTKYDVGPRAHEIFVTYLEQQSKGAPVKKRESLEALLQRIGEAGTLATWAESKTADPRQLILNTAQEVRQTVTAAADLARMLADAQSMQRFREAMLSAIEKVSPEVADQIAAAVRPVLVLRTATE